MVLHGGTVAAVHASCVLRRGVQMVLSGGAQSRSARFGAPVGALVACCGRRGDAVHILRILVCHLLLMLYIIAMVGLRSLASSTRSNG